MNRVTATFVGFLMLTGGLAALAGTASASPAGPVTNSNFELPPFPDEGSAALADTAADECYGVGHQAFYGSDSPQGKLAGSNFNVWALNDAEPVDPENSNPEGAVDHATDDPGPQGTVDQQTDCVYGSEDGYDVAWVHPKARTTQPAHWSMDIRNPAVEFGYDLDDDPFDREVKLYADSTVAHHNLWQWFGSKHQAFTPDADALEMDVEAGDISGVVKLALTTNPLGSTGTNYYVDCFLTFTQSDLRDALDDEGHIAASPLDARFNARADNCQSLQNQWESGDDADKRESLQQTRITQLSFWGWERNTETSTVLDDIQITGATTAAEAAVAGAGS